ncbi:MAG: RNA polymerase sigma factor [Leucothrix sp.]
MGDTTSELGSGSCAEMLGNLLDQTHDNGASILNLVERYVQHFSRRYCNLSFHEQQDIQQEIAVKLLCHGDGVRENCSRSWVYTVVRNQCINHVHKQSNQQSVYKFSENPEIAASNTGSVPSLGHSVDIEFIDRIDCLQKIFDEVEAQQTGAPDIAIYTQYAFGLSYDEISKRSKRTVAAIGNRISVLKKRLKNLVEEYC